MTVTVANAVTRAMFVGIVIPATRIVLVRAAVPILMQMNLDSTPNPTIPRRINPDMPSFIFSETLAANGTGRPLDGWQYEYLPYPAEVQVLSRATTVDVVAVFTSGSETIVEESPVQAGGTAGVTPSPLNSPVQGWIGAAGDRLKLSFRETGGAAAVVDGIIEVQPLI